MKSHLIVDSENVIACIKELKRFSNLGKKDIAGIEENNYSDNVNRVTYKFLGSFLSIEGKLEDQQKSWDMLKEDYSRSFQNAN